MFCKSITLKIKNKNIKSDMRQGVHFIDLLHLKCFPGFVIFRVTHDKKKGSIRT